MREKTNSTRRGFLKLISMAAVACVLPEPPQRLTLPPYSTNADTRIGVYGPERMRITSSGHIMIQTAGGLGLSESSSSTKLFLTNKSGPKI